MQAPTLVLRGLLSRPSLSATLSRNLSLSAVSHSEIEVSEHSPNVYHVRLNRPERRNAFTLGLWREMKTVFEKLSDEPKCRSIVISGNGKSFCTGIDLQQGMMDLIGLINNDELDVGRKARGMRKLITQCQDGYTAIEKCSKPVIAAIHSHCIGAGIDLITACDVRFASHDASFSIKEVDIGLAADVGTLNRIQKVVGSDSWIREVALSARDFGSDEALRQGLVSRVFGSHDEVLNGALELARVIAEKSPIAVQGTKEVLNYSRDHTIDDSLNYVKTWNMSQLLSSDLMNSAMSAMKKEKAVYPDV